MANPKAYEVPFLQVGQRTVSVRDVFRWMTQANASDCYMKIGEPLIFKVEGGVRRFETERLTDRHLRLVMAAFFTQPDMERFQHRREVDLVHGEEENRYRVHVGTAHNGLYAVIRRISQDILPLDRLGLSPRVLPALQKLKSGLVLVAGATGSGKTVTAIALLDWIARTRPATLLTLEDPIEYVLQGEKGMFIQREVGMHVDTFADGVRAALRENLDVIFVGEMRDPDTIEQVLKASEMGHLVISTLHADDSISAIGRVIGSVTAESEGRIRYTLSAGLAAVITQRLLPAVNGRSVLAAEVILPTTAIRNVIRTGDLAKLPTYMGKPGSGITYREHLQELYGQRLISIQTRDEEMAELVQRQG